MKYYDTALFVFGWLFYIVASFTVLCVAVQLFQGYLHEIECLCYVGGAIFIASWGALLQGIGTIINKNQLKKD
ncbi:putative membrane protein [Bacteroides fragilis str. S23L24]|uniref:hypothetical protein n=1 Tax=Bacteroides fragilis TaxID=817 RepID=UPI00044D5296|nr:hypothetical protein [Bacteroides fragilis]EYA64232.1 putative membrane protein [Bacteroides fragilis str. S23L24]